MFGCVAKQVHSIGGAVRRPFEAVDVDILILNEMFQGIKQTDLNGHCRVVEGNERVGNIDWVLARSLFFASELELVHQSVSDGYPPPTGIYLHPRNMIRTRLIAANVPSSETPYALIKEPLISPEIIVPDGSGRVRSDGKAYVHHVRRTDGVGERGHAGDELGREMDTAGAAPAGGYRFILRDPRLLLWAFRGHGVVFAVARSRRPGSVIPWFYVCAWSSQLQLSALGQLRWPGWSRRQLQ